MKNCQMINSNFDVISGKSFRRTARTKTLLLETLTYDQICHEDFTLTFLKGKGLEDLRIPQTTSRNASNFVRYRLIFIVSNIFEGSFIHKYISNRNEDLKIYLGYLQSLGTNCSNCNNLELLTAKLLAIICPTCPIFMGK